MSDYYSSGEAARREIREGVERKFDPAKVRAHIAAWRLRDDEHRSRRKAWSYDHVCAAQIRERMRDERMQRRVAAECPGAFPPGFPARSHRIRKRLNQRDHRERIYACRAQERSARGAFTDQDRDRIALGARRLASWIAGQGRQRRALESRQWAVLFAWALYVKMRREIHVQTRKPGKSPRPIGWSKFGDRLRAAGRGEGERATKNMLARVRELEKPGGPFHGLFTFGEDELWGIY